MSVSESQGPASVRGTPNFYRVMFFLSLVFLVLLPIGVLSSDVWLESTEMQLDGKIGALEAALESLAQEIAIDSNEIALLDAEVVEIARSEQVFAEGSDQSSLWRPDAKWSDMGKSRVQEIWRRRGLLQDRQAQSRALAREKAADLALARAERDRNSYFRNLIKDRKFALYGVLLLGAFGTALSALLWGALVQGRVNVILARWGRA